MASNLLPTNVAQLIGLGTKMLAGLNSLGTTLKITQITPAQFQTILNNFINAAGDFNAARSARQTASDAFQDADRELSAWLQTTRNILAGRFGNRWSTEWAQAGFVSPTTRVPARIEERLGLTLSLGNFFRANPDFEVVSMDITSAQAASLRDAAIAAQDTLATVTVDLKKKGDADIAAYDTLVTEMRSLVKILGATLADNDPRWLAFGLQMPATNTTPGQPQNLTAHSDDTGAIVVQCDATPLAARYRWRMLLVGVETEYRLVARSVDPLASIPGVLPGQKVQIIVQAVNDNRQSVASEPLVFTMPALVAKEAPASPVVAAVPANGASSGNGHSVTPRVPDRLA